MLVLTRKSNQSIMIGDDIEVSVLSIMGEKVRIGIQAPRDVPVFRREVYLEIQQERRASPRAAMREGTWQGAPAPLATPPGGGAAAPAGALAHDDVERLEHRDRDDDGCRDEREHERDEAHRPALVDVLDLPLAAAQGRLAAQRLAALAVDPLSSRKARSNWRCSAHLHAHKTLPLCTVRLSMRSTARLAAGLALKPPRKRSAYRDVRRERGHVGVAAGDQPRR